MSDRVAYDDPSTPAQLYDDCRVVRARLEAAARAALRPAPSIHYDEQPRERPKPQIPISEAAARLAGALNLQLDGD